LVEVKVCVGTSCHLKGSYNVLTSFIGLVEAEGLHDRISLQAAFCIGSCGQGVCVSVDGEKFIVPMDGARAFFDETVRPRLA
jgi:NADH:ubiquinone oxidoreductase subunit E